MEAYKAQPVSRVGQVYQGNLIRPILTKMDEALQQLEALGFVTGSSDMAPANASYVTAVAEAGLSNERKLAAGSHVTITDGGANGNITAAVAGATLSRVNDTNVTLTLGGTPANAVLDAVSLTMGWSGQLAEGRGGTNQSTYAQGDMLYASAANTLAKLTIGSSAQLLQTNGSSAPAWVTMSSDATIAVGGALTIANNAVTNAKLRQGIARSVVGVTGNATANVADIQGTADQVLRVNSTGNALAFGAVSLSTSSAVSGQLALGNGGTNANLTAVNGAVVYSTGSAFALSAAGSSGQILRSAGAASPTWSTATYPATSGAAANFLRSDGTNFLSAAIGASDLPSHNHSSSSTGGSSLAPASVVVTNVGASNVPLSVVGAAAQSNHLTDWKNNAGTAVAYVEPDGTYNTVANLHFIGGSGDTLVSPASPTSSNVQTIQNASGTLLLIGTGADPAVGTGEISRVNRAGTGVGFVPVTDLMIKSAPAGFYLFCCTMECITVGTGSITMSMTWTGTSPVAGSQPMCGPLSLASTGATTGAVTAYVASGDVRWTVSGTIGGGAKYTIRIRITSLV